MKIRRSRISKPHLSLRNAYRAANLKKVSCSVERVWAWRFLPTNLKAFTQQFARAPLQLKSAEAINNANVLCMGGLILGAKMASDMAEVFLKTQIGDNMEEFRKNNIRNFLPKLYEYEKTLF